MYLDIFSLPLVLIAIANHLARGLPIDFDLFRLRTRVGTIVSCLLNGSSASDDKVNFLLITEMMFKEVFVRVIKVIISKVTTV